MKIVVIGSESLRLGFHSAGAEFIAVEDPQETLACILDVCSRQEVGLILITTTLAQLLRRNLDHIRSSQSFPLILEIPDLTEPKVERPEVLSSLSRAMGLSRLSP